MEEEGRSCGEPPSLANTMNNLALLYGKTGRSAEAELLFERALTIHEKAFGSEHPDFAPSLNNLAMVYEQSGRHIEAERMFKRAIAIAEKTLGPEHPNFATALGNLAAFYRDIGRHAEAPTAVRARHRDNGKEPRHQPP